MRRGIGLAASACPVAAIDGAVGVHEEGDPGLVVIELEKLQVHSVHFDEARADEVHLQSLQLFVLTNNLFVETFARNSGHAPEGDEERLFAFLGLRDGPGVVVVNPVRGDRGVFKRLLKFGLSAQGGGCEHRRASKYEKRGSSVHGFKSVHHAGITLWTQNQ
jgi:hypothetical protein